MFTRATLSSLILLFLTACGGLQNIGLDIQILSFTANPSSIKAGEGATLAWTIIGGADDTTVTLTPGDVDLNITGNYQVTPEETTTYTLSVSSEGKTATKTLTISVEPRTPVDPTPPGNPPTKNEPDVACGDGADLVPFEDANLQRAVEKALGLPNNGVSCYTVTLLENLAAQGTAEAQITNLSGLEFARNLKVVNLGKNAISDIAPLGAITTLEQVYLYQNNISNLAPLVNLSNLKTLELSYNDVSDIAPLLSLPWAANDDYVGLKAQSGTISQNQLSALEELVSEVVYDEGDAGEEEEEIPETPDTPGSPEQPENPENPEEPEENPDTPEEPSDRVITGDITVTNQEELDALEGVTEIQGSLIITTDAEALDFIPLDTLEKISSINGFPPFLIIADNPALKALKGFNALKEADIRIARNSALTKVEGFGTLGKTIGWSADPGLIIEDNPQLQTLTDFSKLEISGGIFIRNNESLTKLPKFEQLMSVWTTNDESGIIITDNNSLKQISGFPLLKDGGGSFQVSSNESLKSIDGFEMLRGASPGFLIEDNPELVSFSGFTNYEGGIAIEFTNLPKLKTISAFGSALRLIRLNISNTGLETLDGLSKIGPSEISISNNPNLTTISGLNDLNTFSLSISNNKALKEISGFNDIELLETLTISNNESLTTLSGLREVPSELGRVTDISSNAAFDCSAEPQKNLDLLPIRSSSGNLVNCPTIDP